VSHPVQGSLRVVNYYVWRIGAEKVGFAMPAGAWWDGSVYDDPDTGRKVIRLTELGEQTTAERGEPDFERLSCGHEQPVRYSKRIKSQTYNLRRRCDQCAERNRAAKRRLKAMKEAGTI
jgi:hypothetical protein